MRGDEFFESMAAKPPFNKLHPRIGAFFKQYLAREKIVRFGDQFMVNTNFPPYPSRAFERFAEGFAEAGSARRLHSVTLAVTNRCVLAPHIPDVVSGRKIRVFACQRGFWMASRDSFGLSWTQR